MTKNISIPALTRVEGEGALYIQSKGDKIERIELKVYEPPRFYEGFLRGRYFQEVPDITARICGICPVSHHLASAKATDMLSKVVIPERAKLHVVFSPERILERP